MAKSQPCRIICTQPRRLATTSIAQRVSLERNDKLGQSVGYQIRLDSCVSPKTNLTFTTSGFLLRRIIGERSSELLNSLTHLIFDEVHEREDITDFLLIAIKDALATHPHLKVILMSATLDADIFCKYFSNCPRIDVPGRMFPVEMVYLKEILDMTAYTTLEMERFMQISVGKKQAREAGDSGTEVGDQKPMLDAGKESEQFIYILTNIGRMSYTDLKLTDFVSLQVIK